MKDVPFEGDGDGLLSSRQGWRIHNERLGRTLLSMILASSVARESDRKIFTSVIMNQNATPDGQFGLSLTQIHG
jgi:hypothetical protein